MSRMNLRSDVRLATIGSALVLVALFWATAFMYVRNERERELEQAIMANANLARAFEEHTLRTIKSIDQIVLEVRTQYRRLGSRLDLRGFFRDSELNPDLVKAVVVFDASGNLVVANTDFGRVNVADREHFRVHLAGDSGRLYVGQPIRGRATRNWLIPMTRRITRPDGSFGGTVMVGVDPFYFSNFYRSIDLGKYGVVTLVGLDGFIRARLSGLSADVGQDVRKAPIFRAIERSPQGHITFSAVIDGITRIYAYRTLTDFPLAVAVGVAESEALAPSDRLRRDIYAAAAGVTLLVVAACVWLLSLAAKDRRVRAALERSNSELSTALATLRRAQDDLVRSEKLAALGRMVAGIAHELNTPIGNALMMVSLLDDRLRALVDASAPGGPQASQLAQLAADGRQAARLAMTNIARANELIATFKRVAVDQASSQRRSFDLARTIDDVVETLMPLLANKPYALKRDLEAGIAMESFPGPLGQVITNLVHNALLHGFDGRESGTMTITARREGEASAMIVFADDGVGVPEENVRHIFDPFFTTKLNQGGSGLGLNIVHNLVTTVLGGRIEVSSHGAGTRFAIVIPRNAPADQSYANA